MVKMADQLMLDKLKGVLFMFIMIYYYYYKSSHVMTINMLSHNSGRSRDLDCHVKTRAIVASKH